MKKRVIAVTGTPGTGKTILAKKICKEFGFKYVDVNEIIDEYGLKEFYDRKRKCFAIDVKKLVKVLVKLIRDSEKDIVVDSHLSHYIPKKHVDLCIITKCSLDKLEKRLEKRGYPRKKIRENLDCEIFDVCLNEAKESGHDIKVVDTGKSYNVLDLFEK
ncbi:AAA family ATPase [Candidatus Woesearchaeota archaeon]|nr:AAA family ATPase [Candidatus Woesearchaeota archaeon]